MMKYILILLLMSATYANVWDELEGYEEYTSENRPPSAPTLDDSINALLKLRAKAFFNIQSKLFKLNAKKSCFDTYDYETSSEYLMVNDQNCFNLMLKDVEQMVTRDIFYRVNLSIMNGASSEKIKTFLGIRDFLGMMREKKIPNWFYSKELVQEAVHIHYFDGKLPNLMPLIEPEEKLVKDKILETLVINCGLFADAKKNEQFCNQLLSHDNQKLYDRDYHFRILVDDYFKFFLSSWSLFKKEELLKENAQMINLSPEILFLDTDLDPSRMKKALKQTANSSLEITKKVFERMVKEDNELHLDYYVNNKNLTISEKREFISKLLVYFRIFKNQPSHFPKEREEQKAILYAFEEKDAIHTAFISLPENAFMFYMYSACFLPFSTTGFMAFPKMFSKTFRAAMCFSTIPTMDFYMMSDASAESNRAYEEWFSQVVRDDIYKANEKYRSYLFNLVLQPLNVYFYGQMMVIHKETLKKAVNAVASRVSENQYAREVFSLNPNISAIKYLKAKNLYLGEGELKFEEDVRRIVERKWYHK